MVDERIKKATKLRRREFIPEDERTQERTKAAQWLQENVIEPDLWEDLTLTEIAEKSDWSRQHIANTLDAYFEPADTPAGLEEGQKPMGYRQGFRDGIEFVRDNPEMFGLRRD